ncbi:MAG: ABC transporter substrate-binding protein [Acetobacteraceae bacterium]
MKTLLAVLLLIATPAVAQLPPIEDRVVVATFGGLLGRAVKENIELFTKPLGIQVVIVENASADILAKMRAQRSAPQFDLALLNDQTFVVAKALGLIEKLDPAQVPNAALLRPGLLMPDGYGAPYEINPVGYIYRRDKLAAAGVAAPDSWRAVADPKLDGRVVTFTFSSFYTPLMMMGLQMSAGKTINEDGEIWPFLRHMRGNHSIVVAAPGQAEELARSGEAWVYPGTAERALLLRDQGVDVGFAPARDALLALTNYMVPVRNAPHKVAAQRVLNWILGTPIQTRMAQQGAVVPVNKDVQLGPELKTRLGFAPDQDIPAFRPIDIEALNAHFSELAEGFDKTMAR